MEEEQVDKREHQQRILQGLDRARGMIDAATRSKHVHPIAIPGMIRILDSFLERFAMASSLGQLKTSEQLSAFLVELRKFESSLQGALDKVWVFKEEVATEDSEEKKTD
jgi:hypothetical protein